MTPLLCCGLECGIASASGPHWTFSANPGTFSTATVRSGARSLRANPSASTSVTGAATATAVIAASNKHVWRVYVNFASLPSANTRISIVDGGGAAGAIFKQSDSKIYAGTGDGGAAVFGATGVTVTTGQWYLLDIKIDKSANPWLVDVSVDGTACGQRSSVIAAETTGALNCNVFNSAGLSADLFYDDVCYSQTLADYPIGGGNVYHFVPTADGTHNVAGAADFKRGAAGTDITNSTTDAYLLVDNIPLDAVGSAPTANDYINAIAPPNATDYTENVFGPAPGISTPTVAPRAVEVVVETAQAATATGSFKLNLNDNGTVDTIKEQVTVAGVVAVAAARKHYATAPTGGAWSVAAGAGNFNNLRIRFYSADAAPDQYFVAAMIEAEFAPVVAGSRTALNTRAFPLGTEIGMGWRMPL